MSNPLPDIIEISEGVFESTAPVAKVGGAEIDFLKKQAATNRRRRARLCLHRGFGDPVHEMLIVQVRNGYVRPHKHVRKSESFHMIEGHLTIVIFDDGGRVEETITLSPYASEGPFCYRLSVPRFHTVLPLSDFVVFHETTKGPFDPAETLFAPWAPTENAEEATRYVAELMEAVGAGGVRRGSRS